MTLSRTTAIRPAITILSLVLLLGLSGCGRDKVRLNCSDDGAYQSVVAKQKVVIPEGLDGLDEFKELPIPKAETPPRADDAGCVESPPSILSGVDS